MLIKMLRRTAQRFPDKCALVFGSKRILWRELLQQIRQVANGMRSLGLRQGDRVAVFLPNTPDFVVSFFSIASLGAVVLPLNTQYKDEELKFYLQDSAVKVLITDGASAERCRMLLEGCARPVGLIVTDKDLPGSASYLSWFQQAQTEASADFIEDLEVLMQYSSGTTGRPKRVVRTQRQCVQEADQFEATSGIHGDDVIFCAIPLFHAHGLGNCLLASARSGAKLILMEKPNPFVIKRQQALDLIEREGVTFFPGVPFMFRVLSEVSGEADLSSLRVCFSAGAELPRAVAERFQQKFGIWIRQLYGCTEAGSISINMDKDPSLSVLSVGFPMKGVKIEILGKNQEPLNQGEIGEVRVSGDALAYGYLDLEDESFNRGSFLPGDLGRLDEEGRLYITGRTKSFIKAAGHKVDPAEIEDVLMSHTHVLEAVVVGFKNEADGEEVIKAAVVSNANCQEKDLILFCRERLAMFKVPKIIEFRDEIPKSPLGKILREQLL